MIAVPRVATLGATLPSSPLVLTEAAARWPARRWSLDWLRREHGDAAVTIMRVEDHAVILDQRRGLVGRQGALGDFLAALERGETPGYVMTDLGDLPALERDVPLPAAAARALKHHTRLWISGAGTVSLLHFDLLHNLHTVLSGRKRFTLYPFSQSHLLYPRGLLGSMPTASQVDVERPDYQRFPRLERARPLVAEIGRGETLFLPAMWWHHVRALEHTVAVNAFFASGVRGVAALVADVYKRVRGFSR